MMGAIAALALLGVLSLPGVAALRLRRLNFDLFEQLAFGPPLGMVATTLVMLIAAAAVGFGVVQVLAVAAAGVIVAVVLTLRTGSVDDVSPGQATLGRDDPSVSGEGSLFHQVNARLGLGRWPVLVLGGFIVWFALLWRDMIQWQGGALFAVGPIWGDWAQHLGDVTSFAFAGNVPPDFPRYAGHPYDYHYLASLTAAAMTLVGASPTTALLLHSWALCSFIALGVFAFARRVTNNGGTAALAVALFLLGGNLGWMLTAQDANNSHAFWDTILHHSWNWQAQQASHFLWQSAFWVSIAPQRGYLYGLPLMLLTLTLFFTALRDRRKVFFGAAGLVAGLLPFAHLGPLPVLAILSVGLFVAFPSRDWLWFFVPWAALTGPQMLIQGGESGTIDSLRWQAGWIAAPDNWWWFWAKGLGFFIPLAIIPLVDRRLLGSLPRRFLWSFMPIFAISNLIVFQPDPWDNVKLLTYWFLAVAILAACALTAAWRETRTTAVRGILAITIATMTLSGVLINLQETHDASLWLTPEEVQLALQVRAKTPERAVFAVGLQPNHPVPMFAGRSVVISYPGWFWPRGIDTAPLERELRLIYKLDPATPALLRQLNISYVVIGPWELDNFGADVAGFRARYPVAIETANYVIFDVR